MKQNFTRLCFFARMDPTGLVQFISRSFKRELRSKGMETRRRFFFVEVCLFLLWATILPGGAMADVILITPDQEKIGYLNREWDGIHFRMCPVSDVSTTCKYSVQESMPEEYYTDMMEIVALRDPQVEAASTQMREFLGDWSAINGKIDDLNRQVEAERTLIMSEEVQERESRATLIQLQSTIADLLKRLDSNDLTSSERAALSDLHLRQAASLDAMHTKLETLTRSIETRRAKIGVLTADAKSLRLVLDETQRKIDEQKAVVAEARDKIRSKFKLLLEDINDETTRRTLFSGEFLYELAWLPFHPSEWTGPSAGGSLGGGKFGGIGNFEAPLGQTGTTFLALRGSNQCNYYWPSGFRAGDYHVVKLTGSANSSASFEVSATAWYVYVSICAFDGRELR